MGKHILFALLSGLLVLGMSSAFAEEPQLSDQEILKAWGQGQTELTDATKVTTLERNGLKPLTDADLDEINAAGFKFAIITSNYDTIAAIANTGNCVALIGVCSQGVKKDF